MFERFTERARQVIVLSQDEARELKHNYIGTEHILLGVIREEEGLAARVMDSFDVTLEDVRFEVKKRIGTGDEATSGQIPFTPRAKKVLELALREALSLGHNYVGTEHLLLGLVRENQGVAATILQDFDISAEMVRNEIIRVLSGPGRRNRQNYKSGKKKTVAQTTDEVLTTTAALLEKLTQIGEKSEKFGQRLKERQQDLDKRKAEAEKKKAEEEVVDKQMDAEAVEQRPKTYTEADMLFARVEAHLNAASSQMRYLKELMIHEH